MAMSLAEARRRAGCSAETLDRLANVRSGAVRVIEAGALREVDELTALRIASALCLEDHLLDDFTRGGPPSARLSRVPGERRDTQTRAQAPRATRPDFFVTLEDELTDCCRWCTHCRGRMALFDYVEGFYNPARRHTAGVISATVPTKGGDSLSGPLRPPQPHHSRYPCTKAESFHGPCRCASALLVHPRDLAELGAEERHPKQRREQAEVEHARRER